MMQEKNWAHTCYLFLLLLAISSCEQISSTPEKARQLVYDYSLSVDDAEPNGSPHKSFTVQTGVSKPFAYKNRAHAYLFVYSTIYRIEEKDEKVFPRYQLVPQDTLAINLTRGQTDTIYQLVRRVFTLAPQPELRDSLQPPRYYNNHDIDLHLTVSFTPYPYTGPTFECTGFQEYNDEAYNLRAYLARIEARYEKK